MRNIFREGIKRIVGVADARPRGRLRGKVVAVASLKGGVGKTTTSVNLASALARFHDKRVLLVDLDPQGHVGTSLEDQIERGGGKLSEILTAEQPGAQVMDVVTSTKVPGLFVTPSDAGLADAENLLSTKIGKEFILRDALEVTRTYYDVVLVDCPPNLGNLTANALVACDWLVVPCDLSPLALKGVDSLVGQCQHIATRLNPKLDMLGVVITRFDGRTASINEAVLEQLAEQYGDLLFETRVGINTSLAKAQHAGKEIFEFAPSSRGAAHYRELADAVVARARL